MTVFETNVLDASASDGWPAFVLGDSRPGADRRINIF